VRQFPRDERRGTVPSGRGGGQALQIRGQRDEGCRSSVKQDLGQKSALWAVAGRRSDLLTIMTRDDFDLPRRRDEGFGDESREAHRGASGLRIDSWPEYVFPEPGGTRRSRRSRGKIAASLSGEDFNVGFGLGHEIIGRPFFSLWAGVSSRRRVPVMTIGSGPTGI